MDLQLKDKTARAGLGRVEILVHNAGGSRSFQERHVSEERRQEAITRGLRRYQF